MLTSMCRSVLLSGCLAAGFAIAPASAQQASQTPYTEYVVRAPASIRATGPATANELRSELMDLIRAQAPSIESLRQQDQELRERQQPVLDRLNGEVRTLLDSQRETRDALTSELNALRDEQTAYLNLHPDASDQDLTVLRNEMQALKERQRPIREKMKSDLMALIDQQKPERDVLRQDRLALRESQIPVRNALLSAREDLETRIAALDQGDEAGDAIADAGDNLAPLSSGIAGLEQLTAPAPTLTPSFKKQPIGQMPVRLDLPEQPATLDAR